MLKKKKNKRKEKKSKQELGLFMGWRGAFQLRAEGANSAHPPALINLPPTGCVQKGLPKILCRGGSSKQG